MISRKEEVRKLLRLTPEEVINHARNRLIVCKNLNALYECFANDIASEIQENNAQNRSTRLILPVGPSGQYPILANIIKRKKLSLKNCWFFFMDEYCDEFGKSLSLDHPLSFKRILKESFLDKLEKNNDLGLKQVIFPDESNIEKISEKIDEIGGIDTCYGGIGIHGHIAFNEPEPGVAKTDSRKVHLNDFTITINAIRAQIGGNFENFPNEAYTLGMKQILNSRRIRLYCRSDILDWAATILRIALFGEPGEDYPVTLIRNHKNYVIATDWNTLTSPKILI